MPRKEGEEEAKKEEEERGIDAEEGRKGGGKE